MLRVLLYLGEWAAAAVLLAMIANGLSARRWRRYQEHKERWELAELCRDIETREGAKYGR